MQMKDLQPGQHFMVATKGMRGHFACEMWMNNEDPDVVFPEPWSSDPPSWSTKDQAVRRAQDLANALNIPYVE